MALHSDLTVAEIVELLQHLDHQERKQAIFDLIAVGVEPSKIIGVVRDLSVQHEARVRHNLRVVWWTLAIAAGSLSAFHGYRRNRNVGWALAWFAAGTILPVPTIVIAIAQGYAQRKQPKLSPQPSTTDTAHRRMQPRRARLVGFVRPT